MQEFVKKGYVSDTCMKFVYIYIFLNIIKNIKMIYYIYNNSIYRYTRTYYRCIPKISM